MLLPVVVITTDVVEECEMSTVDVVTAVPDLVGTCTWVNFSAVAAGWATAEPGAGC